MNKRSSALLESVVIALCNNVRLDSFDEGDPVTIDPKARALYRDQQAAAMSDDVTKTALAIVEQVETIQSEAK